MWPIAGLAALAAAGAYFYGKRNGAGSETANGTAPITPASPRTSGVTVNVGGIPASQLRKAKHIHKKHPKVKKGGK